MLRVSEKNSEERINTTTNTTISFQGRYFMLRVSEKNSEERTHGFETPSKGACRHLWKCCLEHQAFFRLMATGPPPLSPYSRFRSYSPPSGSEKHTVIRRNPPPIFQRTPSRRAQRRVVEGQEMVGPFVETPATVNSNSNSNPISGNVLCNTQSARQVNNSSPRSTRSAPWTQSQPRGLYTSSSPRSVRSAGTAPAVRSLHAFLVCNKTLFVVMFSMCIEKIDGK